MDIAISPGKLSGNVSVPSSKSISHRALICAALANGTSNINNISKSDDIDATINVMNALGARFSTDGNTIVSEGISSKPGKVDLHCCESGSTLRFIIPVAAVLGAEASFYGKGRLPQRPVDIYIKELSQHGISFDYVPGHMPFSISGKLTGGKFYVPGNVSSQFITGLLFALPLCETDSEIILTSELESEPYVDITISCLNSFGIKITKSENGYFVAGNQKYSSCDYSVEADFSQAAFFIAANTMGSDINILNLPDIDMSSQGDKKIIEIAGLLCYNKKAGVSKPITIDASDIPDLVPAISVMFSLSASKAYIVNAQRLKIKESDRLDTTSRMINSLGGNVQKTDDGLIIFPVNNFTGGITDSFNDHRIAMAAAIAATVSKGDVTIRNFEAIKKSYPDFLNDFIKLGGAIKHGLIME